MQRLRIRCPVHPRGLAPGFSMVNLHPVVCCRSSSCSQGTARQHAAMFHLWAGSRAKLFSQRHLTAILSCSGPMCPTRNDNPQSCRKSGAQEGISSWAGSTAASRRELSSCTEGVPDRYEDRAGSADHERCPVSLWPRCPKSTTRQCRPAALTNLTIHVVVSWPQRGEVTSPGSSAPAVLQCIPIRARSQLPPGCVILLPKGSYMKLQSTWKAAMEAAATALTAPRRAALSGRLTSGLLPLLVREVALSMSWAPGCARRTCISCTEHVRIGNMTSAISGAQSCVAWQTCSTRQCGLQPVMHAVTAGQRQCLRVTSLEEVGPLSISGLQAPIRDWTCSWPAECGLA